MLKLSSPVTDIPRIGTAKAKILEKLDITHARDFLYSFPRRYEDFSHITAIEDLKPGQRMTVHGRVQAVKQDWGFQGRRRLLRIFVDIADETGVLCVTWYNLRFLPRQLWQGREMYVAGKVEMSSGQNPQLQMRSPAFEFVRADQDQTHTARITPIYPETKGVTSRFLRYQVKTLLPLLEALPEYLPPDIIRRHKLMHIHAAIKEAHFPASSDSLASARRRLRFDELFFLQLAALVRRRRRSRKQAPAVKPAAAKMRQHIRKLPFEPTSAQQRAVAEILADLRKRQPMNRLLQGDVGSGKSAVAQIAAQAVLTSGHKVLYLAPTEILARQQAEALAKSLPHDADLLISATKQKDRKRLTQRLKADEPFILIGTHALLQDDIRVKRLGLVIVDEQHRFGVEQRAMLVGKGTGSQEPHLLTMTATPIPRTLNLTVYGDLDVSILDELPPGRQPIHTKIVPPQGREAALTHVLEQLHQGRQAYVIAPLVEKSEKLQVKSAEETVKEMRKYFPDIAVELVHGRMASAEKKAIMRNFEAGAIQLLCSTAVVEVGINIPNATCMIIEGAERFGLAQLHQFRGRIGRGEHKSYCYLFPSSSSGLTNPRLKILAGTQDGFAIAEEDLRLRGPGDVYGKDQSGFTKLQVASLLDYPLIKAARSEAENILRQDPELEKYPILKKKVDQKNLLAHFE